MPLLGSNIKATACLIVIPTKDGALLRCVFQRMDGQVTPEGLWLTSTADESQGEKFRVVASAVGRAKDPVLVMPLIRTGTVEVKDSLARFIRLGVTEEYSVSMDGVRQDFIIAQRPAGEGALRVELDVAGARAEAAADGVRLVLDGSGRKIAYSRLRVVDAKGRELTARMEVVGSANRSAGFQTCRIADFPIGDGDEVLGSAGLETRDTADLEVCATKKGTRVLAVLVNDADAAYPVRIDPT